MPPPSPVLQTPRRRHTRQIAESKETGLASIASTALYNDDGMPIVDFEDGDVDVETFCNTDGAVPIVDTMTKLTKEVAAQLKFEKGNESGEATTVEASKHEPRPIKARTQARREAARPKKKRHKEKRNSKRNN